MLLNKTNLLALASFITACLVLASLILLIPSKVEKRVFTWWGHRISMGEAQWLSDMKFTDLVVRGVSDVEVLESYNNLRTWNVLFWRHVSITMFFGFVEKASFVSIIQTEINKSPTGKLYFDDVQGFILGSSHDVTLNFLSAVYDYRQNIILAFSVHGWNDIQRDYSYLDFSSFAVDIYGYLPYENATQLLMDACPKVGNLGTVLWAYAGYTWQSPKLTPTMINNVYKNAEDYTTRMTVWDGDEYGELKPSSLYQYPSWWGQIRSLNAEWVSS